jgi:exodeoxyribonuclease VIII
MLTAMTDVSYFANSRLNQSMIKDLLTMSPAEFKHSREQQRKPTDSMRLGTAVHCLTLEPDEFYNRYAIFNFDESLLDKKYKNIKSTKIYKEAHAKFLVENEGKIILDPDTYIQAASMSNALELSGCLSNPDALREGVILQNIFGHDAKGKIDYLDTKNKIILDVKTTNDLLNDDSIRRHIFKWGFSIQATFYNELIKAQYGEYFTFIFLMVRTVAPYDVRPVVVSPYDVWFYEDGRNKIIKGIETLEKCQREGSWENNANNPFYVSGI